MSLVHFTIIYCVSNVNQLGSLVRMGIFSFQQFGSENHWIVPIGRALVSRAARTSTSYFFSLLAITFKAVIMLNNTSMKRIPKQSFFSRIQHACDEKKVKVTQCSRGDSSDFSRSRKRLKIDPTSQVPEKKN